MMPYSFYQEVFIKQGDKTSVFGLGFSEEEFITYIEEESAIDNPTGYL